MRKRKQKCVRCVTCIGISTCLGATPSCVLEFFREWFLSDCLSRLDPSNVDTIKHTFVQTFSSTNFASSKLCTLQDFKFVGLSSVSFPIMLGSGEEAIGSWEFGLLGAGMTPDSSLSILHKKHAKSSTCSNFVKFLLSNNIHKNGLQSVLAIERQRIDIYQ